MSDIEDEVVKLSTVPLTRQKQDVIDSELEKYASATNYVITALFRKPASQQEEIIQGLKQNFFEKFDSRTEYFEDVLKTARLEILRHKRQARYIRNLRDKKPHFEEGEMRFSTPIVEIGTKAIILKASEEEVPLPLDKFSRNKNAQILQHLRNGHREFERLRFQWNKEGYFDVDIRLMNKEE